MSIYITNFDLFWCLHSLQKIFYHILYSWFAVRYKYTNIINKFLTGKSHSLNHHPQQRSPKKIISTLFCRCLSLLANFRMVICSRKKTEQKMKLMKWMKFNTYTYTYIQGAQYIFNIHEILWTLNNIWYMLELPPWWTLELAISRSMHIIQ